MEIHPQLHKFCLQVGVGNVQAHCCLSLVLSKVPRGRNIVLEGLDVGTGQHCRCHSRLIPRTIDSSQQDGLCAPLVAIHTVLHDIFFCSNRAE